jgi:hypothetical protein
VCPHYRPNGTHPIDAAGPTLSPEICSRTRGVVRRPLILPAQASIGLSSDPYQADTSTAKITHRCSSDYLPGQPQIPAPRWDRRRIGGVDVQVDKSACTAALRRTIPVWADRGRMYAWRGSTRSSRSCSPFPFSLLFSETFAHGKRQPMATADRHDRAFSIFVSVGGQ